MDISIELLPIFADPDLYVTAKAVYDGDWASDCFWIMEFWIMESVAVSKPRRKLKGSSPHDTPIRLSDIDIAPLFCELEATTTALYGIVQSQARILQSTLTYSDDPFLLTGTRNRFGFSSPKSGRGITSGAIAHLPQLVSMTLEEFQEKIEVAVYPPEGE